MKKQIIFLILFIVSIILIEHLHSTELQKHFINAKLAYINSDFEVAWNECTLAVNNNEVSKNEAEAFFDLISYVKRYSERKLTLAEKAYAVKSYLQTIQELSDILKKDSNNKKAIALYKKALGPLSEESVKMLLDKINREIEINKKVRNEAFLISLYTEKLILTNNDEKTRLELNKVRLHYNSRQTRMEIRRMIEKLETMIRQQNFSLDEAKIIANNILYIDPDNMRGKQLKEILIKYENDMMAKALKEKQQKEKEQKEKELKEKMMADIAKKVIKKSIPVTEKKEEKVPEKKEKKIEEKKTPEKIKEEVQIEEKSVEKLQPSDFIATVIDIKKKKVETKKVEEQQNKTKAKIHFDLGINRYNRELYREAKDEFLIAKSYNPLIEMVDTYIEKCEEKESLIKQKKNIEIKKDINKSRNLVKEKKIEKAISILYDNIIKKNIDNKEGSQYLNNIFKKNIINNRLSVNRYSSLFELLQYFKKKGEALYEKKQYSRSIIYWEGILEFFPENELALENWYKNIKKIRKPEPYLKHLFSKGIENYNNGDYYKSLFFFSLISRAASYHNIKGSFKNLTTLKKKSEEIQSRLSKTDNQLSQVYNSAILDFINGNYSGALAKWEYILKIDPGNLKARFNLNKVNMLLSQKNLDIGSSLSENKRKEITQTYYKGIIAYNQKKYKRALYWFQEVLKIYPKHPNAQNNIKKLKVLLRVNK
ncbi:MAG: tetratricopeptide repeat protein [Spirochaetes bacterium]|nr:tetratricopeptide repeat protein [Spirochaetota bacterium]